jgi:nucleoside-diphosphate-sugar epimerase
MNDLTMPTTKTTYPSRTASTNQAHLLCFGYGYCARVLATRLLEEGWQVTGTTRSVEKGKAMKKQAVNVIKWRGNGAIPASAFQGITHILHSIRPEAEEDSVLQYCGAALAELSSLEWVGYFSTIGVYGNHDGGWVDESTPVSPTNKRNERRVQAERDWHSWGRVHNKAIQVFRLPSIYGPGRNILRKLMDGTARRIDVPNHYFSRIHVYDIATVLQASINHPRGGEIYNVCDNVPESAAIVTEYAAKLLGITPPPLQTVADANLSPMVRSFYQNSKRVRNDKIKQELGVVLAYPDYKVGLRHLLETNSY